MPQPQPQIAAKTMSVKLDLSTRARVENLAEARQRTAHWVMREAITQYVDRKRSINRVPCAASSDVIGAGG
jgi:hypothetical protein